MTSATNGTTNGQPDAHHHANGNVDPHDLWPAPGGPIPGADGPSPLGTAGFRMNHTMLRITDPEVSIPFYRDVLGFRRVMTLNNGPCTVYYMAYYYPDEKTGTDIFKHMQQRDGLLELVHVHGSKGRKVENGNPPESFGFGHLGISCPDTVAAEERFKAHGVEIFKPLGIEFSTKRGMGVADDDNDDELTEGFRKVFSRMIMIRDPDGYFIEVVPYGAG